MGDILAVARRADLSLAIALAEDAERPRTWYGIGRLGPGPLRLIVVRGSAPLDSLLPAGLPPWGAGFAFPGSRTVVIRADAGDPFRILRHELAHMALHTTIRARVPLWFAEGYAAVAAGEWDRLDALQLNLTVARGVVPTLDALDRALRGPESSAGPAYALAASAVLFAARKHPTGELSALLGRLIRGEGFDEALLAATGYPPGRFEVAWQREVRRRYGLFVWMMAGGLWAVVGIAVLAAGWLRKRRDRHRRAALDVGWVVEEGELGPERGGEAVRPLDPDRPAP